MAERRYEVILFISVPGKVRANAAANAAWAAIEDSCCSVLDGVVRERFNAPRGYEDVLPRSLRRVRFWVPEASSYGNLTRRRPRRGWTGEVTSSRTARPATAGDGLQPRPVPTLGMEEFPDRRGVDHAEPDGSTSHRRRRSPATPRPTLGMEELPDRRGVDHAEPMAFGVGPTERDGPAGTPVQVVRGAVQRIEVPAGTAGDGVLRQWGPSSPTMRSSGQAAISSSRISASAARSASETSSIRPLPSTCTPRSRFARSSSPAARTPATVPPGARDRSSPAEPFPRRRVERVEPATVERDLDLLSLLQVVDLSLTDHGAELASVGLEVDHG